MRRVEQHSGGHVFAITYGGGRLADVHVDGRALDAVEVGEWDWGRGLQRRLVLDRELAHVLATWIEQSSATCIANNLPAHAPHGHPEFLPDPHPEETP